MLSPKHTHAQGILAPVLASASLFGFYLLIKYLPDFNPQVREGYLLHETHANPH